MLVYGLKVSVFVYIALVFAYILAGRIFNVALAKKVLIIWGVMLPFLFVLRDPFITIIVYSGLLILFTKDLSDSERLFFFIAGLAAVPTWSKYVPNLPGFSGLYVLSYWKVIIAIVLIPFFFKTKSRKYNFNIADIGVILFFIYTSIIFFSRSDIYSATVTLRHVLDNFLYYLVPYFVISRIVASNPKESLNYAAWGFLILSFLLCSIFLFNQVFKLDLYNVFRPGGSIYGGVVGNGYRGSFLRTEGPLAAEGLGIIAALGGISLFILSQYFKISFFKLVLCFAFFTFAVVTTGSRGALFSFILSVAVFKFFNSNFIARFGIASLLVVALIAYFGFYSSEPVFEDEYGTFEFRELLFEASFDFLEEKPFFGDLEYAYSGYFDHLRRGGSGFIDVVSVYLTIALPYGYVGLVLYLIPLIFILFKLSAYLIFSPKMNKELKPYTSLYLSVICGYLFLVSTVSDVGLIVLFGSIVMAICRGIMFQIEDASTN
ncbi:MAG: O-antigen ligase family protein [Cellvibrionaceae bacterium]